MRRRCAAATFIRSTLISTPKSAAATTSRITFAGSAAYLCKLKGDFTDADLITAEKGIFIADEPGHSTALVVTVLGELLTGSVEILKVSDDDYAITKAQEFTVVRGFFEKPHGGVEAFN